MRIKNRSHSARLTLWYIGHPLFNRKITETINALFQCLWAYRVYDAKPYFFYTNQHLIEDVVNIVLATFSSQVLSMYQCEAVLTLALRSSFHISQKISKGHIL